ncbi:MAG: sugar phosphate isomerase/epimerase [Planctomycetota bacterium]|nr:MAG: sugar phosphate isomerase/epimerase [Planctomycetota bacterium]
MSLRQRLLSWLSPRGSRAPATVSTGHRSVSWKSRIAIHQTTTRRHTLEQDLDNYPAAGFAGIGLCGLKSADWSPQAISCAVKERGLSVSSVGIAGGFTRFNGFTSDDAVREGIELIRLAATVGAPVVRVVSGPMGTHIRAQARRTLIGGLRELVPIARHHGVQLALQPMAPQFHKWSFLHTLDETMAVLAELPAAECGLALGTYHLGHENDLMRRLTDVASRVVSVQLADWVETQSDCDRHLPGEGTLPLAEIVTTLESAGYRGWYELEVWSRDLWKQDAATLMSRCQQSVGSLIPVATPVALR